MHVHTYTPIFIYRENILLYRTEEIHDYLRRRMDVLVYRGEIATECNDCAKCRC